MPRETDPSDLSVIRRKARVADSSSAAGGTALTRLWHMTLPRVADEMLGLQIAVRSVNEAREAPADLCATIADEALLLLLAAPDMRQGIAIIDPGMLAALTEVQMTGHVTQAPPSERRPTLTDAAICTEVIDCWITAFEAGLAELGEPHGLSGMRQSTALTGARAAEMALGQAKLAVVRIALDLGGGAKQGTLTLAAPPPTEAGQSRRGGSLGDQLKPALMESETELAAVLHRTFLPYGTVTTLSPGEAIDLPRPVIGAVTLETVDGRPVASGRLGQAGGVRAIRVNLAGAEQPEAPAELAPLPAVGSADPPGLPTLPEASGLPDLPADTAPGLPDLPLGGDLPALDIDPPGAPGLPAEDMAPPGGGAEPFPPLPDLPDLGEAEATTPSDGGLPDLSDLPGLPDIPMAAPGGGDPV